MLPPILKQKINLKKKHFSSPVTQEEEEERRKTPWFPHPYSPGGMPASQTHPSNDSFLGSAPRLMQRSAQGHCSCLQDMVLREPRTNQRGWLIMQSVSMMLKALHSHATVVRCHTPAALNLDPQALPPATAQGSYAIPEKHGDALSCPILSSNKKHSRCKACS